MMLHPLTCIHKKIKANLPFSLQSAGLWHRRVVRPPERRHLRPRPVHLRRPRDPPRGDEVGLQDRQGGLLAQSVPASSGGGTGEVSIKDSCCICLREEFHDDRLVKEVVALNYVQAINVFNN